jgi:hypothetical protein
LQQVLQTRYNSRGVIAIDNTLVDHEGKLIEDVGWFWDHADARHVIAHDYLISNYVCPSGAHYPIEWRRFKKRVVGPEGTFKDHAALCIELIDDAMQRAIPATSRLTAISRARKSSTPCSRGLTVPAAFLGSRHCIPRGVKTQRMTHKPVVRLETTDLLHLLLIYP